MVDFHERKRGANIFAVHTARTAELCRALTLTNKNFLAKLEVQFHKPLSPLANWQIAHLTATLPIISGIHGFDTSKAILTGTDFLKTYTASFKKEAPNLGFWKNWSLGLFGGLPLFGEPHGSAEVWDIIEESREDGKKLINQGHWKEVRALYIKALCFARDHALLQPSTWDLSSHDPAIFGMLQLMISNLGLASYKLGLHDASISFYTVAIKIFRAAFQGNWLGRAYCHRGLAFCALGKYRYALMDSTRAVEHLGSVEEIADIFDSLEGPLSEIYRSSEEPVAACKPALKNT